ncbi:hypothetical protein GS982_01280 [Rhodococcus hoagii]|uniref:Uncharacterized protein n=1 Tax=Rhodococcus hoagii TaxID=43767 RepID=A0A9Q4ZIN1_RHOHA|nr:hypothetical protein [Prescottella equi]NKT77240.1 hypothetical protein [Prescottella equi]NKZ81024.1 hypothetical protein [Prescottella equi]
MPYNKFHDDWKNDPDSSTPITAEAIEHIETGVATAQAGVDAMGTGSLAPGWRQRWFGGAIRNLGATGGYWQPISDGAHWPFGMPTVTTTTVGIEVNYDFEGAGIGTVLVSPDETMAAHNWVAGASVEKNKATLKIARHKTVADHLTWDGTKWNSGGGGMTGTWSTAGGGALHVTHEKMYGQGISFSVEGGVVKAKMSTARTSSPDTEVRIQLYREDTNALIATTAEIPNGTRIWVTRMDAFPGGAINPQSAPDQTALPNSNFWLLGVHHTAPRPVS